MGKKTRSRRQKKPRRWRRRILWGLATLLLVWGLVSHFIVRRLALDWLEAHYVGEASVPVAVLWPWMDADAFGVTLAADEGLHRHRLVARRVSLKVNPWALFGGRLVEEIHVVGLKAEIEAGSDLTLFTDREEGSGSEEGAEADEPVSLEPAPVPPIRFTSLGVDVLEEGRREEVLRGETARLEKRPDGSFRFVVRNGVAGILPFEKLSARLLSRNGRFLLHRLKMHAFNGLWEGFLEIGPEGEERVNGELRWQSVELEELARYYALSHAAEMDGRLEGSLLFTGPQVTISRLKGKGRLRLSEGNFVCPVSMKVVLVLELPVMRPSVFRTGEMTFSFERSRVYIEEARGHGSSFDLKGQGIVTFGGHADLEVTHGSNTVAVSGHLSDPKVKVLPLNYITRPFERIFRDRLPE